MWVNLSPDTEERGSDAGPAGSIKELLVKARGEIAASPPIRKVTVPFYEPTPINRARLRKGDSHHCMRSDPNHQQFFNAAKGRRLLHPFCLL